MEGNSKEAKKNNLQSISNLLTVFSILIGIGYVVTFTGIGIQNTTEDQIYTETSSLVSCDKWKLEYSNTSERELENGYSLKVTGYVVITISMLFIVLLTFFNQCFKWHDKSLLCDNKINCVFPGVMTLVVIVYQLALHLVYSDRLRIERVAKEYYYYSTIVGILIFLQICFLIKYIYDKFSLCPKPMISSMSFFIYLLSIINLLLLGISNVILKYFSTDG